jgi:hypothetical protein
MPVSVRHDHQDPVCLMPFGKVDGRRNSVQINANRACHQDKLAGRRLSQSRGGSDVLDTRALLHGLNYLEVGEANRCGISQEHAANPTLADQPINWVSQGVGAAVCQNLGHHFGERFDRSHTGIDHSERALVIRPDPHVQSLFGSSAGNSSNLEAQTLADDGSMLDDDVDIIESE